MDAKKAQRELITSILKETIDTLPPTRSSRGKFLESKYEKDFIERAVNNLFFSAFGIALFDILSYLDSVRWTLRYNGETFAGLKKGATQNPDPNNLYRQVSEELIQKGDQILQNLNVLRDAATVALNRAIIRIKYAGFQIGRALYEEDEKMVINYFTTLYQAFAHILKTKPFLLVNCNVTQTIGVIEIAQL